MTRSTCPTLNSRSNSIRLNPDLWISIRVDIPWPDRAVDIEQRWYEWPAAGCAHEPDLRARARDRRNTSNMRASSV